ncbi:anthranilate synthase component I family protein [Paenibacillus sp. KQZ6P-2]|uniref:Anthranilate synthase component I family protein n=2 Tax=Paenibacillus mangrovi TaxID=2931978 RepID=A0A9X1WUY3_9BACL|nr:anthranilate synthase component I family protein [Paenibacillus mangrovi]MCJ8015051.1 anthranilate synthase component I family protein [Paenibacillus mangrovi]
MITLEYWKRWVEEGYTILPYVLETEVPAEAAGLPASWSHAWEQASPHSFVLESGKDGRYTYLGLAPVSLLQGKGHQAEIHELRSGSMQKTTGAPLEVIKRWMEPFQAPSAQDLAELSAEMPPFLGGSVGFLGYDIVRFLETIPTSAADNPKIPDYLWMRLEEVWIYDHATHKLFCTVHTPVSKESGVDLARMMEAAQDKAERMLASWRQFTEKVQTELNEERNLRQKHMVDSQSRTDEGQWPGMRSAFSQQGFERAVEKIQNYIRQGDVFQVNLSLRQEQELLSEPERIYEWLRILNPSPYMGLLRSPGFSLVSASPELLVKRQGELISARPIAGTRRRGLTREEDQAMAEELLGSEKERAEHVMLVDLERNDIGKVAAYGTVSVPELMTIEHYSHVMHLVSQVEGRLAEGKGAFDVIAALFPGGTITGAPKVRTMEIIEELEPVRRGPYTGSMGWIDYNGNLELNIIIRTLVVSEEIGMIQTGAGVVIDSEPYREYRECHNKAKAIVKAVLLSEEEAAAGMIRREKEMRV